MRHTPVVLLGTGWFRTVLLSYLNIITKKFIFDKQKIKDGSQIKLLSFKMENFKITAVF